MTTVEDAVAVLLKTASSLEGNASAAVIDLVLKLQSALSSKEKELNQELTAKYEARERDLTAKHEARERDLTAKHEAREGELTAKHEERERKHEEREAQLRNSYNSTIQSLVREHRLENQHQADMRESGKRRYPATHVF